MSAERDLLPLEVARRQALRDQAAESAREMACEIVAFRDELVEGHLPRNLANELTREYVLKQLGVTPAPELDDLPDDDD